MVESGYPYAAIPVLQSQWSNMLKTIVADGVATPTDLAVVGDSTGMQVKVAAGSAWVQGFFYNNSVTKILAIGPNASGNPRIDLVVLTNNEIAGTFTSSILAGTPAAVPVVPTLTQNLSGTWQMALAQVAVGNGVATITAANVTDLRTFTNRPATLEHTWAVPGIITVPVAGAGYIPPIFISVPVGSTKRLRAIRCIMRGPTSATVSFNRNGVAVPGLGAIVVGTVAQTVLANGGVPIALTDADQLAPVVTAITGIPDGMTITTLIDVSA